MIRRRSWLRDGSAAKRRCNALKASGGNSFLRTCHSYSRSGPGITPLAFAESAKLISSARTNEGTAFPQDSVCKSMAQKLVLMQRYLQHLERLRSEDRL